MVLFSLSTAYGSGSAVPGVATILLMSIVLPLTSACRVMAFTVPDILTPAVVPPEGIETSKFSSLSLIAALSFRPSGIASFAVIVISGFVIPSTPLRYNSAHWLVLVNKPL